MPVSMSVPARIEGSVEWMAPKSVMTKPVKPSSSRSTWSSSTSFSHAKTPLILLNEHITEPRSAFAIASA